MKQIMLLFAIASIIVLSSCGKDDPVNPNPNTPKRYRDAIYTNVSSVADINYGSNVTFGGATKTLTLDIYFPEGDTAIHRPLLVLLPGGGFGPGTSKNGYIRDEAIAIAKYGYVVACINYRIYDGTDYPVSNHDLKKVILQGMQDARAAIRFFRKDAATTNTYKINPDKIFLAGHSAGAFVALHAVYLDDVAKADADFQNIIQSNGGLEGDSGNDGYSSSVSGILNLAGALLDKNYITSGGKPLKNLYGTADDVIPFDDGNWDTDLNIASIPVSGSNSLNTRARSLGINSTAYVINGGDHGSPANPTCSGCLLEMAGFMYSLL